MIDLQSQAVEGDKALVMADLIQTAVTILQRGEALYPFHGLQGFPDNYPMLVTGDAQVGVARRQERPLGCQSSETSPCYVPFPLTTATFLHPTARPLQSNAVRGSPVTVLANATELFSNIDASMPKFTDWLHQSMGINSSATLEVRGCGVLNVERAPVLVQPGMTAAGTASPHISRPVQARRDAQQQWLIASHPVQPHPHRAVLQEYGRLWMPMPSNTTNGYDSHVVCTINYGYTYFLQVRALGRAWIGVGRWEGGGESKDKHAAEGLLHVCGRLPAPADATLLPPACLSSHQIMFIVLCTIVIFQVRARLFCRGRGGRCGAAGGVGQLAGWRAHVLAPPAYCIA